jgi:hypothetical protein
MKNSIFSLLIIEMLLFTTYVNDEYTAKKMAIASKKLGKKLGSNVEMVWQWVKNGNKLVIACDFHKYD